MDHSATVALIQAIEGLAKYLEKTGTYYYDTKNVKRWVLGDGGKSGNCDICEDNEALGWIDDDAVFESVDGSIDDAPAHPHCTCTVEYGEKRYRVYV